MTRREGFEPEYFHRLVRYEDSHFWFVARRQLLLWIAATKGGSIKRYLEVGCGSGAVLSAFAAAHPDWQVAGTEVFAEGLQYAARRVPGAFLFQADATRLPLHESIDLAGAFDVLEHVSDDAGLLIELHRTLKPGGLLLLSVPQHAWLWSAADDHARHQRRYGRAELLAKLSDSGFRAVFVTSFNSILLPLMVVARLRRWRQPADAWGEFEIPRWLNLVLLSLLRIENAAIRMGMTMPMGGSLVVLARKTPKEPEV